MNCQLQKYNPCDGYGGGGGGGGSRTDLYNYSLKFTVSKTSVKIALCVTLFTHSPGQHGLMRGLMIHFE